MNSSIWLLTIVLMSHFALAQSTSCRQSWMPADAPAFCPWQQEPPLPEGRSYSAIAISGSHVFLLGGFRYDSTTNQVKYYDTALRSDLSPDGHLGNWISEALFTNGRSGAAAATAGQCLFLSGGSSSTPTDLRYYDDVQYARIDANGRLSDWKSSKNHFGTPRSNHSLLSLATSQGSFLIAVAGVTQIGNDTVHLDTVETAKIGTDCSVGPWSTANYHLKGGRSSPQALLLQDNIVVIGGWGDSDLLDVYRDVQTTAIRPDGSPMPWQVSSNTLPTGIYGHATVMIPPSQTHSSALLLSIGGQPGTGAYSNWVSYAYVSANAPLYGAIGNWRIAPNGKLPTGRAGICAAQSGNRIYVFGGNDSSNKYYGEVLSAEIDPGHP